jgi:hypothetical protein
MGRDVCAVMPAQRARGTARWRRSLCGHSRASCDLARRRLQLREGGGKTWIAGTNPSAERLNRIGMRTRLP